MFSDLRMIDIQTYRARIGSAPGMMSKILQRKEIRFKHCKRDEHEDEDLLRKIIKTVTISQLSNLLLILLLIVLTIWKPSVLLHQFRFETNNLLGPRVFFKYYFSSFDKTCNDLEELSEGLFAIICTGLCLSSIGAVHFISILLFIAGIELNPGPNSPKVSETESKQETIPVTQSDDSQTKNSLQNVQIDNPVQNSLDFAMAASTETLTENGKGDISESTPVANKGGVKSNTEDTESLFSSKTIGEVKLTLRGKDIRSKERFEEILHEIDQSHDSINNVDLCLSTFCSKPWSEHPDGYRNMQRLLSHPKVQFVKTISLEMCTFSAHDTGGLLLSLEQKVVTKADMKMLHEILNYAMSTFEISCVEIRKSRIDREAWGEHPQGQKLLDELLMHRRLQAASIICLDDIGLTIIPASLGKSHQRRLIQLDVSSNNIVTINTPFTGCKNLVDLNLSDNLLVTLPETINLPNLQTLNLECNPMYEIPATLAKLPKLRMLTIGSPETRTINTKLLDRMVTKNPEKKLEISARNNPEELKAPTADQLASTKSLRDYMSKLDSKLHKKEKKLKGKHKIYNFVLTKDG